MDLLLSNPYEYLDSFLLVFVRVSSLFIAVPFFSNRNIPAMVKIGLAIFVSSIIINVIDLNISVSSSEPIEYLGIVLIEVFIGWIIGFSVYMTFTIVILSGQFIDQQIGFAMVNVFDPLSQIQLSITGNLYYYLVLLVLLITNKHFLFLKGIIKSYEFIPVGRLNISGDLFDAFIKFYSDLFIIALQIAAPFFLAMLVTNVILGILARTAPQLNLFVIGFPLKIMLGLLVLMITITVFDSVSTLIFEKMTYFMEEVIKGLSIVR